jgi:hypothetical protein
MLIESHLLPSQTIMMRELIEKTRCLKKIKVDLFDSECYIAMQARQ